MNTASDLSWYFGSGAQTWQGDAGLRSPFGGQLERAARREAYGHHVVDASQAEEQMIDRLGAAWLARLVEARLAVLTAEQRDVLSLHYAGRRFGDVSTPPSAGTLPFGISRAAILSGDEPWELEVMRAWLMGSSVDERRPIESRGRALVQEAEATYARACREVAIPRKVHAR